VDKSFKVVPPDPHGFDSEADGLGCEADNRNDDSNFSSIPSLAPVNQICECKGSADCFRGVVTEIIDGDTIDVNNVRIRLSMVNTPERGEIGYNEATAFTESICHVGSNALVDEDEGQKEGSYNWLIGVVYCNGSMASVNQLLLGYGKAIVYEDFCEVSEFANDKWVTSFGCMVSG
jgi:micrococcal nuclease